MGEMCLHVCVWSACVRERACVHMRTLHTVQKRTSSLSPSRLMSQEVGESVKEATALNVTLEVPLMDGQGK